ncbi:PD-(D/E)XK motif protein [Brevundimonas sp.]|uniref:PD-(D/E)XK motif protein n=1 Tax=Brevundimonas sp. TaxID=1871086 RepID=UPI0035AE0AC8
MAAQTDTGELRLAWSALAGQDAGDGWRTISLGSGARFRAGIVNPGSHQTLLVGFNDITPPRRADLPEGGGFVVRPVDEAAGNGFTHWMGVTRQAGAPEDLFTQMTADIIASIGEHPERSEVWLLTLMLARIRAWQDFMRRPRTGVLTPEAELGLAGELAVLEGIIAAGTDPVRAVDAWQGPSGSLHDFLADTYGLEVKSTLSVNGFPARISSLEQLDESQGRAVLLAAVRFCLQADGRTLTEIVAALRTAVADFPQARSALDLQLLRAGWFDAVAAEYVRRFALVNIRLFPVGEDFPRLARATVRPEIRAAEYELDLDLVGLPAVPLADALAAHGVF